MEKSSKIKREKRISRHNRVRKKIFGNISRPRLSIFRSNRYIYAQLIDDENGQTLVAANDLELKKAKTGKEEKKLPNLSGKKIVAYQVGFLLSQKAMKKNIKKAIFDRGGFLYHGRIEALADGAREGGLEF